MKKATLISVVLVCSTLLSSNLSAQQFPSKRKRIIVLTIYIIGLLIIRNLQLSIKQI